MNELYHHGILKQKWGVRHGPPYPLKGGDYSPSEKKAILKQRKRSNSIYNKKHFDTVISTKDTIHTLSYDKDRLKGADMFYATVNKRDFDQYNTLFNSPTPKEIYDEGGIKLGTGKFLKFDIRNTAKTDIKVASEDSAADVFKKLYSKDRDFYNFVTDETRMRKYFVDEKYKFKGYRESRAILEKIQNEGYKPTENDVHALYRMFNYVIPYDGRGNAREAKDVLVNRTKFFKAMKEKGYGAVLDTNDGIYGGFKAKNPVIIFDMEQVVPKEVYQTKMSDKRVSTISFAVNKMLWR